MMAVPLYLLYEISVWIAWFGNAAITSAKKQSEDAKRRTGSVMRPVPFMTRDG
jgi:Sec-independent protein secretion pathway component TatC